MVSTVTVVPPGALPLGTGALLELEPTAGVVSATGVLAELPAGYDGTAGVEDSAGVL